MRIGRLALLPLAGTIIVASGIAAVTAYARPGGPSSAGRSGDASSLVHAWNADGNTRDSVGHDNGTLRGATYAPGPSGGKDRAFNMSGHRQGIRFNHRGGNFGRSNFTVSIDVRTSATTKQAVIEKRPVCDAASFWSIRLSADGLVQPELMSDSSATDYTPGFSSITAVNDGSWHTVLLSRAGRTVSLYIDGNFEASAVTEHVVNLVNDTRLRIGIGACVGVDGTRSFRGQIDEVRLYASALTP
jgi:hypothetical protein